MAAIVNGNTNGVQNNPTPERSQKENIKNLAKREQAVYGMAMLEASAAEAEKASQETTKNTEHSSKTTADHDQSDISENPVVQEKRAQASNQVKFEIWKMELEEKLWEALLNWQPSDKQSLSQNIQQLQQIYEALKTAILQYTTGEEQLVQLARLREQLSQVLGRLLGLKADELIQFLSKYGQSDTIAMVKASLYKMVTGEKLFPKDAQRFLYTEKAFLQTESTTVKNGALQINSSKQSAEPSFAINHGSIYQKTGNQQIAVHPLYQAQSENKMSVGSALLSGNLQNAVKLDENDAIFGRKGSQEKAIITKLFSADDIEKASRFLKHISVDGLPFSKIATQDAGAELLGMTIGILALKAHVFSQSTAIGENMSSVLKNAVDNMIRVLLYYDNDFPIALDENVYQKKQFRKKDTQVILKIYNYILKIFYESKDVEKALSKGMLFALKLFSSEKENDSQYFFNGAVPRKYISFKEGLQIIRNNWNQFTHSVELQNSSNYELDISFEKLSLWGAGEKQDDSGYILHDKKSVLSLCLWLAILAVVSVAGILSIFSVGAGIFAGVVIVLLLAMLYLVSKRN